MGAFPRDARQPERNSERPDNRAAPEDEGRLWRRNNAGWPRNSARWRKHSARWPRRNATSQRDNAKWPKSSARSLRDSGSSPRTCVRSPRPREARTRVYDAIARTHGTAANRAGVTLSTSARRRMTIAGWVSLSRQARPMPKGMTKRTGTDGFALGTSPCLSQHQVSHRAATFGCASMPARRRSTRSPEPLGPSLDKNGCPRSLKGSLFVKRLKRWTIETGAIIPRAQKSTTTASVESFSRRNVPSRANAHASALVISCCMDCLPAVMASCCVSASNGRSSRLPPFSTRPNGASNSSSDISDTIHDACASVKPASAHVSAEMVVIYQPSTISTMSAPASPWRPPAHVRTYALTTRSQPGQRQSMKTSDECPRESPARSRAPAVATSSVVVRREASWKCSRPKPTRCSQRGHA